jgi:hypothetical protein
METTIQKEQKFHRSPTTQQLVQFFASAPVGQLITYEKLSEVACCDIRGRKRHYLESALDIVSRDYGILYRTQHSKGVARLGVGEISSYANQRHRSRFREDTKRYQHKIDCVDSQLLEPQDKQEYSVAIAYLGLRYAFINPEIDQTIRRQIAQSPERQIDKAQLLEQIKNFG